MHGAEMPKPANTSRFFPLALAVVATIAVSAVGAEPTRHSASTGYALSNGDAPSVSSEDPGAKNNVRNDKIDEGGDRKIKPRAAAEHRSHDAGYWIYAAATDLTFDEDHDGFFSGIDVTFDADTDYFGAEVYARLYLSLEGGPWVHYYTTDVFTIYGAGGDDDYRVETDLLEGYPTGYYDLLIELYDIDYDEHVASFGPADSPNLSLLPLEDFTREIGIVTPFSPPVSSSSGGGGSTGLVALFGLVLCYLRRHAQHVA